MRMRKLAVGTVKKSIAAISRVWFLKKTRASLRRWLLTANHVSGHGQLCDLVAEQMKLRTDPASSPGGVVAGHATDEDPDLPIQRRPPAPAPRLPAPVEAKSLAVPAEYRLGLHDEQARSPASPQAREPDPEDPISPMKPRTRRRALEDVDLLAEGDVLGRELGAALEQEAEKDRGDLHRAHRISRMEGLAEGYCAAGSSPERKSSTAAGSSENLTGTAWRPRVRASRTSSARRAATTCASSRSRPGSRAAS